MADFELNVIERQAISICRLSEYSKDDWKLLLNLFDKEIENSINECLESDGDKSTRAKGKVDALRVFKSLLEGYVITGRELREEQVRSQKKEKENG